jgi:transcriptional regulator with XRE-family HTH domain
MKHKTPKNIVVTPTTTENDRQAKMWRQRLRDMMEEHKMSQRALAEAASLGPTSIRHAVTKNGTITIETLRRLSNAFNTPMNYLLTGQNVSIEVKGDNKVAHEGYILPIHGTHDVPENTDCGLGTVFVSKEDCGKEPYAFLMEDNSMMGIGANFQPDLNDIVLPGEVVVWDMTDELPTPGDLVMVDLGDIARPRWAVRLIEQEEGDYYVAALTRSHGRLKVPLDTIAGRVTHVIRKRRS